MYHEEFTYIVLQNVKIDLFEFIIFSVIILENVLIHLIGLVFYVYIDVLFLNNVHKQSKMGVLVNLTIMLQVLMLHLIHRIFKF